MTDEYPDTEGAVREWLRTRGLPLVGEHVYFGIPTSKPAEFVTIGRIGGGPVAGSLLPLDVARLSLTCWGSSKKKASDIANAVVSEVRAIEATPFTSGVVGHGGEVDSVLWQPAADTDTPRYIVDVTITAQALDPVAP